MSREFAKEWSAYEGAVKVWMLPFKRIGFNEAYAKLSESGYNETQAFFAVIDWVLVDAEIASNAPAVWRVFKKYMEQRKLNDLVYNWEIFKVLGSSTIIDELNVTYTETRETLLSDTWYDVDEEASDTDPES